MVKFFEKKAHIVEVQINGGYISDKVEFTREHFEKKIPKMLKVNKEWNFDGTKKDLNGS